MKETLKKNIGKRYEILLYIFYILLLVIINCFIHTGSNDDAWFAEVLNDYGLTEYLRSRYNNWTSRIPIEVALVFLTRWTPWIWKILNIAVLLLLVQGLSEIFGEKHSIQDKGIFMLLLLLLPFAMLSSAGWIATTVNYLWPITMGVISLIPICRWERGEKISKWEYGAFSIACILGCFQEQVVAVVFVVYILYIGYCMGRKIRIPRFCLILLAVEVILLLFILTCPGNANRSMQETQTWFPEFAELSYGSKVLIGYLSTFSYYVSCGDYNGIFLLFVLVMFCAVMSNTKNMVLRCVALFPVLVTAIWGYMTRIAMKLGLKRGLYFLGLIQNEKLPEFGMYSVAYIVVECLVFALVLGSAVFALFCVFGKTKDFCIAFIVLGAGLCSKMIMGLSPTVYASGSRTATLGSVCFVALIFMCLQKILEKENAKKYIMGLIPCYLSVLAVTMMTNF